jgi:hypothetical protein
MGWDLRSLARLEQKNSIDRWADNKAYQKGAQRRPTVATGADKQM